MAIGQKLFSKNPITGSSCRSLDISLVVSCGYLYTAKFSEQPFVETYAGLLLESYSAASLSYRLSTHLFKFVSKR